MSSEPNAKAAPALRVSVIVPALNEESTIFDVIQAMPRELVRECIVVNNGSSDRTAERALQAGAVVVDEPTQGYGRACATGAAHADQQSDVLVFLDGDGSDVPAEIVIIAAPVLEGRFDFVIGSRLRGRCEPGSLLPSQVFAGWLAGIAMRLLYRVHYTDMGPLRAISRTALNTLQLTEMTYGWNLEMQMKAARAGLRILELPTTCRCRRGGVSKIAGSLRGSIKAAFRILLVLVRVALTQRNSTI